MKRRHERSESMHTMHLWDWSEASKAVPYLHSIVGSLREHWLEVLNVQRQLDRLAQQKGPLKREQLIEEQMEKEELQRDSFVEAQHGERQPHWHPHNDDVAETERKRAADAFMAELRGPSIIQQLQEL